MRSRYNLMKPSLEFDEVDLEVYPDPLTIDYSTLTLSEAPYQYEIDDIFIQKPFIIMNSLYGNTDLDDIILDINDVMHIQQLSSENPTILILPISSDILAFYTSNQAGEDLT